MEKIIKAEVFGDSAQALFSKRGTPYVKCTLVTKDDEGSIDTFFNACFFPSEENVQKIRSYLCKGREVEVTGNYSERTYEGKDGTMKTAHDILVHNVRFGGIVEYGDGEAKNTDFSFIKDSDRKAADAQLAKSVKKPAKKQQTTAFVEPDEDGGEDDLFAVYDKAKASAKAKAAKPKAKKAEEDEDFDMNDLDL